MALLNVIEVQSILKRTSGVPADSSVNTWHFLASTGPTLANTQEVCERVRDFFIVNPVGQANNVASQLASTVATTGHEVRAYWLADPPPRVPRYSLTFGLTPGNNANPGEMAVCLSYQADRVAGIPQSRRRGRVFIGPTAQMVNIVGGDQRPTTTMRDRLCAAANDLEDKNDADAQWVVFSPTSEAADPVGYAPPIVTNGWVDDAYDVIRGRGAKATTRTLWS